MAIASGSVTPFPGDWPGSARPRSAGPRGSRGGSDREWRCGTSCWEERTRGWQSLLAAQRGQGTVEYVGLVLLVAVLIAGVVKASGGFSDTGIADAVVDKLKGAIKGVGEG